VIRVGGHTPGQSVVLVNTSHGVVLLASDSVHYYEEYERNMPFTQVANLIDMYAGFDRIRAMRADHLVAGHDPGTLGRFAPCTLAGITGLAATIGEEP
jgi:glyoxylase-like metal-dependent hydrolase (beta-lactamase superfamily II)